MPWDLQKMPGEKNFRSVRIQSLTQDRIGGLSFELLLLQDKKIAYIHIFSQKLESGHIKIRGGNMEYEGEAKLLEGGQRLLLSEELQNTIVSSLLKGEDVTLTVGPYQEKIAAAGFLQYIQKR